MESVVTITGPLINAVIRQHTVKALYYQHGQRGPLGTAITRKVTP